MQQSVYQASETAGFVTVCAEITVGQLQDDVSVGLQSFVLSSDTASIWCACSTAICIGTILLYMYMGVIVLMSAMCVTSVHLHCLYLYSIVSITSVNAFVSR